MAHDPPKDPAAARALIRERIGSGQRVTVEQIVWAYGRSGFAKMAELAEANGALYAGDKAEAPAKRAVLGVFEPGTRVIAGQAVRERTDPRGRRIPESTYVASDGVRLAWARIRDPAGVSQIAVASIGGTAVEGDLLTLRIDDADDALVFRCWSSTLRDALVARMSPARPDAG